MAPYPHPREFSRSPVRLVIDLMVNGAVVASASTRDVGLKGAFLFTERRVAVGSPAVAVLRLGDDPRAPRPEIASLVVRQDPDGIALEFLEMDVEALHHLRGIVLYNAADPDAAEREFDEHVGLRRRD